MAGRGPAPKAYEQRRNHHAPQRGEWTELGPLVAPVLPALPRGEWSARTKAAWKSWRADPATGMYGSAEIQLALDLAYVYEEWVRKGGSSIAGEIRQRLDGLGLSPKGKQDRRWRLGHEPEVADTKPRLAEVRTLRIESKK